jgi:hypothetical protein
MWFHVEICGGVRECDVKRQALELFVLESTKRHQQAVN